MNSEQKVSSSYIHDLGGNLCFLNIHTAIFIAYTCIYHKLFLMRPPLEKNVLYIDTTLKDEIDILLTSPNRIKDPSLTSENIIFNGTDVCKIHCNLSDKNSVDNAFIYFLTDLFLLYSENYKKHELDDLLVKFENTGLGKFKIKHNLPELFKEDNGDCCSILEVRSTLLNDIYNICNSNLDTYRRGVLSVIYENDLCQLVFIDEPLTEAKDKFINVITQLINKYTIENV